MNKLFSESQKALINLPARNDNETENFFTFDFPAGSLDISRQEFIFPSGLHVDSSVKWLDESLLLVKIGISCEIESECARCLKPVNLEISGELMYLYYSHGNKTFDEFGDSYDEYMPVEIEYFARVLDIMPQIRESVYTLLPTKILCKEDCAGLCPECGADLNLGKCSCENKNIDLRFESLRNFVIE